MPRRLRAFFRTKTLQGSTGQFALSGKDAILTRGGSPIFTYIPPHWLDPLPSFSFAQGVPSSQSFAGYFAEGNGGTSTITGQNLPSGVTVNSAAKTLVYDGNGAIASSATATLTADDGYEDFTAITSLVVRETAGTAGMVFKEGDVPADRYVVSSTGVLQARVKNSWPDGSAKIAVLSWSGVTASQASPATLSIGKTATPPTGSDLTVDALRGLGLTGSVSLGAYGSVNLATIVAGAPFRTWLYGPKCSEWHWWSRVGSDPTLVVWFHVRLYANGRVWVRTVVENTSVGNLSSVVQAGKRYHAIITLNGVERYKSQTDSTLAFPATSYLDASTMWYAPWSAGDTLPHWSRSRWTKVHWYDGSPIVSVSHNGEYMMRTKLLPWFGWETTDAAMAANFNVNDPPLGIGAYRASWPPGSEHQQIGTMPTWEAYYLASAQGSDIQDKAWKSLVANGNLMGTFKFWRDETTNELPVWSDYPTLTSKSDSSSTTRVGSATDLLPYVWDRGHSANWGYLPYLVTGDYYYVEQAHTFTTSWWIDTYPEDTERMGIKNILYTYGIEARHHAFGFRNMGQAACITPDSVDTNSYEYRQGECFRYSIEQNILRLKQAHIDGTAPSNIHWTILNYVNPLGVVWEYPTATASYDRNGRYAIAPWMQHYCMMALKWVYDMKLHGNESEYNAVLNHALKFPVGMLGLGDANGWPYSWCGAYGLYIISNKSDSSTCASDWTQAYEYQRTAWPEIPDQRPGLPSTGATMLDTAPYDGGYSGVWNGYTSDPTYEWVRSCFSKLNLGICAAVDHGIPGAQAAYDRLKSLHGAPGVGGTFGTYAANYYWYPNWALKPRNEPRTIA